MSPSAEQILEAVRDLLRDADLNTISAKNVRKQLEEKFGVDLTERKKEVNSLIMQVVDEMNPEEEEDQDDDDNKEEVVAPARTPVKRKSKPAAASSASPAKRVRKSDAAAASPAKKPKAAKKASGEKASSGRAGSGYVAPLDLSPELSALMGEKQLSRAEVVKRMWAIVKERNLKDPKDGRYCICDDELMTIFGTKRFKTFGMMKYLKTHLKDSRLTVQ